MRAIINAMGDAADIGAFTERLPSAMLPIIDRPMIQHVLEYIVDRGVTHFEIILGDMPEKIEELFGDGSRWGVQVSYRLLRHDEYPTIYMRTLDIPEDEIVVWGQGDRLPEMPTLSELTESTVVLKPDGGWSGWSVMPWKQLRCFADMNPSQLAEAMCQPQADVNLVKSDHILSNRTYSLVLEAHRTVLDKQFPGLMLSGREVEPGVWICRNVVMPSNVVLTPPVFIGESTRIGSAVHLGPHAVIGRGCVLDSKCSVCNSVIFPNSFVGEGLELKDTLIDRNLLVNARDGGSIVVRDNFILGSLNTVSVGITLDRVLSQLIAAVLWVVTLPIFILVWLLLFIMRGHNPIYKFKCVKLPATDDDFEWQSYDLLTFLRNPEGTVGGGQPSHQPLAGRGWSAMFLRVLPGLWNVAMGHCRFVGVAPRSAGQVKMLPKDWRSLYLKAKGGLMNEADVRFGNKATEDEVYAAEAFYAVSAGIKHDLNIGWHFLLSCLSGKRS